MTLLRPARAFDALAVASILGEFVDTTPWMPRIHSHADDLAHAQHMIGRGWVTVAEQGQQITGFCASNGGEVNAVYVGRASRGQGVGQLLLNHLKADQTQLELWTFQANEGAQRFYLRHGFVEVQRTDGAANDENLPDIKFQWTKDKAA